jgi:hypothetical protein
MWYLWCGCTPNSDVVGLDRDAIGFHIAEKDEFMICGVVSNEKASAVILTRVVRPVADGHEANRDVWEDDFVFAICMKAAKRDGRFEEDG